MANGQNIELIVDNRDGQAVRLDQYLTLNLTAATKNFSRSYIQKLIDQGMVSVGIASVKAGFKLRGGEKITVKIVPNSLPEIAAQDIPLDILFEDNYLLVVNKPAGMVTHPGAGIHENTLVNALLYHCGESLSGISGVARPGIVHRLDKDTSGLLVVAKENKAHLVLSDQIKHRNARRTYLAVVEGDVSWQSGIVDKPLARHAIERKKMAVSENGRKAVTHYEVLQKGSNFCLIKANLETGRTHQIRVHMASLGLPVVGDLVYNRKTTGNIAARKQLGLVGHALHATYLAFQHPINARFLEFEVPPPQDFQKLLAHL